MRNALMSRDALLSEKHGRGGGFDELASLRLEVDWKFDDATVSVLVMGAHCDFWEVG